MKKPFCFISLLVTGATSFTPSLVAFKASKTDLHSIREGSTEKSYMDASANESWTRSTNSFDMVRVKECAEHFGECSVEEMTEMRDMLHKRRFQKFLFGENPVPAKGYSDTLSLEDRLLEEELDLQLGLLQEHEVLQTSRDLFPEVQPPMKELPHLKDETQFSHDEEVIHNGNRVLALDETILEESILETAAICLAIGALWFVPHLLDP